jgi:hypothetical protein
MTPTVHSAVTEDGITVAVVRKLLLFGEGSRGADSQDV